MPPVSARPGPELHNTIFLFASRVEPQSPKLQTLSEQKTDETSGGPKLGGKHNHLCNSLHPSHLHLLEHQKKESTAARIEPKGDMCSSQCSKMPRMRSDSKLNLRLLLF